MRRVDRKPRRLLRKPQKFESHRGHFSVSASAWGSRACIETPVNSRLRPWPIGSIRCCRLGALAAPTACGHQQERTAGPCLDDIMNPNGPTRSQVALMKRSPFLMAPIRLAAQLIALTACAFGCGCAESAPPLGTPIGTTVVWQGELSPAYGRDYGWSLADRRIAVFTDSQLLVIIDTRASAPATVMQIGQESVIRLSPDGNMVAVGMADGQAAIATVDGTLRSLLRADTIQSPIEDIAWNAAGTTLSISGENGRLALVDVSSGDAKLLDRSLNQGHAIAFASDSSSLVIGDQKTLRSVSWSDSVWTWNDVLTTNTWIVDLAANREGECFVVSCPEWRMSLVRRSQPSRVYRINTRTGEVLRRAAIRFPQSSQIDVDRFAMLPDRSVMCASTNNMVVLPPDLSRMHPVTLYADGSYVAALDGDRYSCLLRDRIQTTTLRIVRLTVD